MELLNSVIEMLAKLVLLWPLLLIGFGIVAAIKGKPRLATETIVCALALAGIVGLAQLLVNKTGVVPVAITGPALLTYYALFCAWIARVFALLRGTQG